jgi:carbamoyltransferase
VIILGLHFGHDAAISILKDGRVLSYIYEERFSKVKHSIGLSSASLVRALREAGVGLEQVDYCAISSTQGVELLTDGLQIGIDLARFAGDKAPCYLHEEANAAELNARLQKNLIRTIFDEKGAGSSWRDTWAKMFLVRPEQKSEDFHSVGWLDDFINEPNWEEGATLDELAAQAASLIERRRFGFHLPVTVRLGELSIPGYFVHHHMAHAASSYYASPFSEAAVMTHDGYSEGRSYHSGMFYYGKGHKLYPIAPHHLNIGALYDRVGLTLRLGTTGPAGKLMGLAGWGKPRFFNTAFVGNYFDQKRRAPATDITSAWLYHCAKLARTMGYDMTHYTDPAHATAPINADLAASTQKLFEAVRYKAVESLYGMLVNGGIVSSNLCLSGGTALNCPSNTQIFNEGPFTAVHVEPACDDGGLSIGAALAVYHNILDRPRGEKAPYVNAYLGAVHADERVDLLMQAHAESLLCVRCEDPGKRAAHDVHDGKVIAWYQGRSEAGPRALGHRSIIADPRIRANWARVNQLKSREPWRPFAPAVLQTEASKWFGDAPAQSPFMLFNAQVLSAVIPAVTHKDGTARIQTVTAEDGEYHSLIEAFFRLTGVPVVMNTSLNGPGEPIMETRADTLSFFATSQLDVLYMDEYRITRREGAAKGGAA